MDEIKRHVARITIETVSVTTIRTVRSAAAPGEQGPADDTGQTVQRAGTFDAEIVTSVEEHNKQKKLGKTLAWARRLRLFS